MNASKIHIKPFAKATTYIPDGKTVLPVDVCIKDYLYYPWGAISYDEATYTVPKSEEEILTEIAHGGRREWELTYSFQQENLADDVLDALNKNVETRKIEEITNKHQAQMQKEIDEEVPKMARKLHEHLYG